MTTNWILFWAWFNIMTIISVVIQQIGFVQQESFLQKEIIREEKKLIISGECPG